MYIRNAFAHTPGRYAGKHVRKRTRRSRAGGVMLLSIRSEEHTSELQSQR